MTEAVPKGYNQTEIGVIPEDWEVDKLGNRAFITKLAGFEYSNYFNSYKDGGNIIVIRGTNITNNKLDLSDVKNIPLETSKKLPRSKLFKNDLVFAYVGTIGPVFLIGEDNKYHLGPNTSKISVDKSLDPKYLFNYFTSWLIKQEIIKQTSIGAQPSLSMTKIRNFKIIFPKSKEEQKAITQALSETDELIQHLDKLILKKKDIKTGAMQELLTRKKRLPRFSEEWEDCLFSDIIELNKGQQLNRSSLTNKGEYPAWNGGIEPSGYTNKWNAKANTITISEGGNSCGFVNYCTTDFWCGGHCYALRILNPSTDKSYLYHLLKFKEPQIMSLRIGSGLPNIQKKNLYEFELKIPKDTNEQSAIARILSEMYSEIEELEQKRNKYQMIKEGMMQQLLTGKIRLNMETFKNGFK